MTEAKKMFELNSIITQHKTQVRAFHVACDRLYINNNNGKEATQLKGSNGKLDLVLILEPKKKRKRMK